MFGLELNLINSENTALHIYIYIYMPNAGSLFSSCRSWPSLFVVVKYSQRNEEPIERQQQGRTAGSMAGLAPTGQAVP
jgi:hypothetical protein